MERKANIATPAAEMKRMLSQAGLPFHAIECYGSQITVECKSRESCAKWATLLEKFAKVRGMIKSGAYVGETMNSGSPRTFEVWRVYAAIR